MEFDGFEIYRSSTPQSEFEANSKLDFKLQVSDQTGVVSPYKTAEYRGIKVVLCNGRPPRIKGSVLKYHNNGVHNYNNISYSELIKALQGIALDFGIDLGKEVLTMLEVGINIILSPPLLADTIISNCMVHKGTEFRRSSNNDWYSQAEHEDNIIKTYNKGRQYNLGYEVLRHEKKIVRMRYLHSKGVNIVTLSDLLNVEFYPKLGAMLIESFKEILFRDPLKDLDGMSHKDRELVLRGMNKTYWTTIPKGIFETSSAYNAARQRQRREEARFRELCILEGVAEVLLKIKSQWEELTQLPIYELSQIPREECSKFHAVNNTELSQIPTLNVLGNCDKDIEDNTFQIAQSWSTEIPEILKPITEPEKPKTEEEKTSKKIWSKVNELKKDYSFQNRNSATFGADLNGRPSKDGLYTVFVRITENRVTRRFKMPFRIPKEHFNSKYGKWISRSNSKHAVFNREIENKIEELKLKYQDLAKQSDKPFEYIKTEYAEATLGNYINDYLKSVKVNNEIGYYRGIKSVLGQFYDYFGANTLLADIAPHNIDEYKRYRLNNGDATATVNGKMKRIHKVFITAVSDDIIIKDPFRKFTNLKI